MKIKPLRSMEYSPGYGDMRGTKHCDSLRKNKEGEWVFTSSVREYFDAPTVITTYEVSDEAVGELEEFLAKRKVEKLIKRRDSKMFITDYSPWSYSIDFDTGGYGDYLSISQYKEYSKKDMALLDELQERFYGLRGKKISETSEKEE